MLATCVVKDGVDVAVAIYEYLRKNGPKNTY
jgi:hypothetical protein